MSKDVSWDRGRYSSQVNSSGRVGPLQQNRGYGSGSSYKADPPGEDMFWVFVVLGIMFLPFILIGYVIYKLTEEKSKDSSKIQVQNEGFTGFGLVEFIAWMTLFGTVSFFGFIFAASGIVQMLSGEISADAGEAIGGLSVFFSLGASIALTLLVYEKKKTKSTSQTSVKSTVNQRQWSVSQSAHTHKNKPISWQEQLLINKRLVSECSKREKDYKNSLN